MKTAFFFFLVSSRTKKTVVMGESIYLNNTADSNPVKKTSISICFYRDTYTSKKPKFT